MTIKLKPKKKKNFLDAIMAAHYHMYASMDWRQEREILVRIWYNC